MNVRLLRSAVEDLASAREFYERQEIGIGDYFLDASARMLIRSPSMAGSIGSNTGSIEC